MFESLDKTGRLIVADVGWKTYGMSAEIAAMVVEKRFDKLKAPVGRVSLPDVPAPASAPLEKAYYPTHVDIVKTVKQTFG